eukprot:TRINITY_DN5750_c0_g7_i2.p1 TRINITY_DN5750_c0_g7~~TRINITY_DN5750_c0_g7_i2.p1  ORF type:complete len:1729 (-),score=407.69 TRINITY_DN5750_c0_g7_i2:274-5460(-)
MAIGLSLSVLLGMVLLRYIYIPLKEYLLHTRLKDPDIAWLHDPADPCKDRYFEGQAKRAVKVQFIVMPTLFVIWVAWTIMVTEAIRISVSDIISTQTAATLLSTENSISPAASINIMQQWDQVIGSNPIQNYIDSVGGDICSGTCDTDLDSLMLMYQEAYPGTSYVYVGFDSTGDWLGAGTETGSYVIGVSDSTTGSQNWEYEANLTSNTRTSTRVNVKSYNVTYDSRTRPWFQKGKAVYDAMASGDYTTYATNATWTEPYSYFATGQLGVTHCKPFWNSSGFLGVFGVDLPLTEVSTGLQAAGIDTLAGGDGRSWVVDSHADMIGSSTGYNITAGTVAYAFEDSEIAGSSINIATWFSYDWLSARGHRESRSDPVMDIKGVGSYVDLSWIQVLTAPYSYFYQQAEYQIYLSFVIIVLVFASAAYSINCMVVEIRNLRMWDVKSRLFNEYDDPNGNPIPVFKELAALNDIRAELDTRNALAGDTSKSIREIAAEMIHLTMLMIKSKTGQRFVKTDDRLKQAINYLTMAQLGNQTGTNHMVMVHHFSRGTGDTNGLGIKIYVMMSTKIWKDAMSVLIIFYTFFEYAENDDSRKTSHIIMQAIALAVLLFDAVMMWRFVYIQRGTLGQRHSTAKVMNLATVLLNVACLILLAYDIQDPIRFSRPLMVVWRSLKVLRALRLFATSLLNAANVFLVYGVTIIVCSIFALILFREVLTASPKFDTFMDSLKHTFVVMATGENYADILPNVLPLSKWYFLFFLFLTLIGMFFLTSLVIATFERQYDQEVTEMKKLERERRLNAIAPAFCLWTYHLGIAELDRLEEKTPREMMITLENLTINKKSFRRLMHEYWNHEAQRGTLIKLCYVRQRRELLRSELSAAKRRRADACKDGCANHTCSEHRGVELHGDVTDECPANPRTPCPAHIKVDRLQIELLLKNYPLTEPAEDEVVAMKEIMYDYSERVFKLLDVDGSENVDFMEFEEICMYLNLMPQLHFNEVFFLEMQRTSLKEVCRLKEENLKTPQKALSPEERARGRIELNRIAEDVQRLDYEIERAKIVSQDKFWFLSEIAIDKHMTTYCCFHLVFLAFYGTDISNSFINVMAIVFTSGHIIDVSARIIMAHTRGRRYFNSEHPQVQFKRRGNIFFVAVSAIGLVMYLMNKGGAINASEGADRLFQTLMAFSTLRILTLVDEFSKLMLSISAGISPVRVYTVLLCVCIYEFATFAYCAFRPGGWAGLEAPAFNNNDYWDSPVMSAITMYQLLVGENWHGVMNWTEEYTYKPVMLFFIMYTMIVSVLFAQLFIGIMIQMFQDMEEKREQGGDMYVILGRLYKGKDMDEMNKVIYGLMNTRISLDYDYFDVDQYATHVEHIKRIQNHWRQKMNHKLFKSLQKELHPVCALYNLKFGHNDEIVKYLANVPLTHVYVKGDDFKADSWIEQHALLSILVKRFNYFTQFTEVLLQNGQQIFELTSFLATQLNLTKGLTELAPLLLPPRLQETERNSNQMGIFEDIVKHGDLTVLVDKLKETGINLSGKGNRRFADGTISTVEQDLYDAAAESLDWHPLFAPGSPRACMSVEDYSGLQERSGFDATLGEEEDVRSDETWQQILVYCIQAAKHDWRHDKQDWRYEKYKLFGAMEDHPPAIPDRAYDSLHFYESSDSEEEEEEREKREAKAARILERRNRISAAVDMLDRLARVVRLRALLSRTNFGTAWNFVDFAHWFTEAFVVPIAKKWL